VPSTADILSYRDVSLTYSGSAGSVAALAGYSLELGRGEPVCIIGPSGCGKSSSLLLAAGLLKPTEGSVCVAGEEVSRPRLATALILQDFGLLPWKTVRENAALGLRIRHFPREERQRRTDQALEQVGLSEFARAYPAELSGGMRQRLALARALALDVDLMLMDEPLSALDALLREDLQNLLLSLWQTRGYAQLLVTHSIEEAAFLGRRIIVLGQRPGRVASIIDNVGMGSPDYRGTSDFHRVCQQIRAGLTGKASIANPKTPSANPRSTPSGGEAGHA
jgi:NitT/TauT family transport system ATP-binding protein